MSDYLPQFTDLIVLDDVMKENPSFRPATEVVRIKHLLSFTSGLVYPWRDMNPERQIPQYSAPHSEEDPIGEFFRLVKVCDTFLYMSCCVPIDWLVNVGIFTRHTAPVRAWL